MYWELNTSDTSLDPLNNLRAYSAPAAFGVNTLGEVKNSFSSDDIFIYKKYINKNI